MVAESRQDQYGTVRTEGAVWPGVALIRRISWGAVFAGLVIVLVIQLLLSLLGLGVGLTTIEPASSGTPSASRLGTGAAIWWVILNIIAVFCGGWVAGRLAGFPRRMDGILHGLVTWGAATLLLFYLLTTTVSSLISGTLGVLGNAVSAAGQGLQQAASAVTGGGANPLDAIRNEVQQTLNQAGAGGQPIGDQTRTFLQHLATGNVTQADQQNAANELAARTGMSPQDAQATVQRWQANYEQAVAQARQAAETAAKTVSQASFWSFIALLLGAIAGALGGMVGAPNEVVVRDRGDAVRTYG